MAKLIAISAGHSNTPGRDRGAVGNGYIEGELAVELRNLIVAELKNYTSRVTVDANNTILADTIKDFKKKVSPGDIVIDIHWNAGAPKATGVETLVSEPSTAFERKLAKALSDTVSETLGIQLRGDHLGYKGVRSEKESQHSRLGFLHLNGENVLLEVCFISNEKDMKSYQENKELLAKKLAKVLFDHSNFETVVQEYTVVSGDTLSKIALKYKTTVAALKKINKLTSDTILIGQKLKVK